MIPRLIHNLLVHGDHQRIFLKKLTMNFETFFACSHLSSLDSQGSYCAVRMRSLHNLKWRLTCPCCLCSKPKQADSLIPDPPKNHVTLSASFKLALAHCRDGVREGWDAIALLCTTDWLTGPCWESWLRERKADRHGRDGGNGAKKRQIQLNSMSLNRTPI